MCPDCEARRKLVRDAWTKARLGEAAAQVVKGAAEAAGLKKKTGAKEAAVKKQPAKSAEN